MTWQPIETAPKDGTDIDVWVVDQYIRKPELNRAERITGARWTEPSSPHTSRTEGPGWMRWASPGWEPIEEAIYGGARFVTHWMPLPDPPTSP